MIKKQYSKTKPFCKVTFSVATEDFGKNADVRVLGGFNNWDWNNGLVLKQNKKQYNGSIDLPAGMRHEFRYLINGETWANDAAADSLTGTPFASENSVVVLHEVKIAPKATKKAAPKAKVAKAKPAAKKATAKKAATTKKASAKKVVAKKDDLKKIEGIGPKIAGLLKIDGIATFLDLSKAKTAQLKTVLEAAGSRYKMHDPTTWPQQAALAAKGEWDKLQTLQDKLKGGKK